MKKAIKYILLGIASVVLLAGGYLFYELKIKQYDVADEQVDAIVNEAITVDLPDGTTLKLDAEGNVLEEIKLEKSEYALAGEETIIEVVDGQITAIYNKNKEAIEHENIKIGQQVTIGENKEVILNESPGQVIGKPVTQKPAEKPVEKATVASIKANYQSSFAGLEGQARGKLGGVISQAKAEYIAKATNGEAINYSYFYQKYYGAATGLEAGIDASFETLYARLVADLQKNGFDSSHAESFRTQYSSTKSALRSELMSQIQ